MELNLKPLKMKIKAAIPEKSQLTDMIISFEEQNMQTIDYAEPKVHVLISCCGMVSPRYYGRMARHLIDQGSFADCDSQ